jgi:Flp pilus assembly protein TadD
VNAIVKKNVKVTIVTDACRSGKLAGGVEGASLTINSMARNFSNVVKLLSCQPNQLSLERYYPDGGHGLFTKYCVMGLMGIADKDSNHVVTLRELDFYLDKVSKESDGKQIPKVDGDPTSAVSIYKNSPTTVDLYSLAGTFRANEIDTGSQWKNNLYYKQFNELLSKRLLTTGGKNAYSTLQSAESSNQPKLLVRVMKEDLAASLEDDVQSWMNKYLAGDLGTNDSMVAARSLELSKNLNIVQQLLGEDDFRMKELKGRQYFFQAYHLYKKRDMLRFPDALALLSKADSILPNQAWILNVIGVINMYLNNFVASEAAFAKAIILSPSWNFPANNMATLLLREGKFDQAENLYKQFLNIDSNDKYTWNNLGTLYITKGKYEQAEYAFLKSLAQDSSTAQAWNNLAVIYLQLGKLKEAEAMLNKVKGMDPNLYSLSYNYACLFAQKGNFETSAKYLEESIKKGFTDLKEIESDETLHPLRRTQIYKEMIKRNFPENK